ncbi:HNH endonuclease [Pseudonocardiaceae bacterium YIM PH 21723]|nr:HNH endonuclease [Pseudonocardiaceae bacterium YIM PH 21723]
MSHAIDAESFLDEITRQDEIIAAAEAARIEAIAGFAHCRFDGGGKPVMGTASEIALEWNMSRGSAEMEIRYALGLVDRLPRVLGLLRSGRVDVRKARTVVDAVVHLSDEQARDVEDRIIDRLPDLTLQSLQRALARAKIKADPEGAERRRQEGRKTRRVAVTHDDDGMGQFWLSAEGHRLVAVYAHLDQRARALKAAGGEERTMDQLRADIAVDLLLGKETGCAVQTMVYAYMPMTMLMGLPTPECAELAGYGPIPDELAREIFADSIWKRVITDPVSGLPVDVGRTMRTPPAAMAERVKVRDRVCRMAGCLRDADKCDIDHVQDWAKDGVTADENLADLCKYDHALKDMPGWGYELLPNGDALWTTPTGRSYLDKADPLSCPQNPDTPPF